MDRDLNICDLDVGIMSIQSPLLCYASTPNCLALWYESIQTSTLRIALIHSVKNDKLLIAVQIGQADFGSGRKLAAIMPSNTWAPEAEIKALNPSAPWY